MSFLNPVNEPVKRFKSTDADAPQINYAARTAGDIKAVLKACLVTGYGTTESAGWTIANEVDNVCEFVSPSAAMSDYRLGIDDSTATKTDWYYQYQDARVNPNYNSVSKSNSAIDKTSAANGWELLITDLGLIFIENIMFAQAQIIGSTVSYFGQVKSTMLRPGENIAFWSIGFTGGFPYEGHPSAFFGRAFSLNPPTVKTGGFAIDNHATAALQAISTGGTASLSDCYIISSWYYTKDNEIVAMQPGVDLMPKHDTTSTAMPDISGISDKYICVWPARGNDRYTPGASSSVYMFIRIDTWEY